LSFEYGCSGDSKISISLEEVAYCSSDKMDDGSVEVAWEDEADDEDTDLAIL
jgi:hypothetical protein